MTLSGLVPNGKVHKRFQLGANLPMLFYEVPLFQAFLALLFLFLVFHMMPINYFGVD